MFADFDNNIELSNIEEDLMDEIIIELINDIFNITHCKLVKCKVYNS